MIHDFGNVGCPFRALGTTMEMQILYKRLTYVPFTLLLEHVIDQLEASDEMSGPKNWIYLSPIINTGDASMDTAAQNRKT